MTAVTSGARVAALALLAQLVAATACGVVEIEAPSSADPFCAVARCAHGCDEVRRACAPPPAPVQLVVAGDELRIEGDAPYAVLFVGGEVAVIPAEDAPAVVVGELDFDQQLELARWHDAAAARRAP